MEGKESISKLNPFELEVVLKWVDGFELSRCRRKLNRDFSDGVLLAEILKVEFPNFIEMHNYSGCFSLQGKLENWDMLNRKVLKKIQVNLKPEEIDKVAKSESNIIEEILFRVMNQIEFMKNKSANDLQKRIAQESSSVMTVKVLKQVGDQIQSIPQKMIQYSIYEDSLEKLEVQQQKIQEMQETIDDLLSALNSKSQIIEDLQSRFQSKQKKYSRNLSIDSFKESFHNFF